MGSLLKAFRKEPSWFLRTLDHLNIWKRKSNELPFLRPDGKSQITVEYSMGKPKRIDTVVVSTQHDPNVSQSDIYNDVSKYVIEPIISGINTKR